MSGHNKWSKIKRAKGAADAKRSKQWSNILKQVAIAVREGGPDPDSNPRLRLLVQNARGCNMPKDTLQRSISKANDKDAAQMQELTFECHVSHGIALFIEALSDNNNRTVANVKSIMNKYGGTLETNGSLHLSPDLNVFIDGVARIDILQTPRFSLKITCGFIPGTPYLPLCFIVNAITASKGQRYIRFSCISAHQLAGVI